MLEVVDGQADPRMGEAELLIDLVQEDRQQGRLPVVAVDDVRVLAGLPQEFDRGPGKEGEALHIVVEAVDAAAVEEVVMGVRLDEEALAPMHEAEEDGAVDGPLEPGHPEVAIDLVQFVDLIVAQVGVFGQDDLDMVAADGVFAADAEDHVCQAADLGHRGHLGGDVDDEQARALLPVDRGRFGVRLGFRLVAGLRAFLRCREGSGLRCRAEGFHGRQGGDRGRRSRRCGRLPDRRAEVDRRWYRSHTRGCFVSGVRGGFAWVGGACIGRGPGRGTGCGWCRRLWVRHRGGRGLGWTGIRVHLGRGRRGGLIGFITGFCHCLFLPSLCVSITGAGPVRSKSHGEAQSAAGTVPSCQPGEIAYCPGHAVCPASVYPSVLSIKYKV